MPVPISPHVSSLPISFGTHPVILRNKSCNNISFDDLNGEKKVFKQIIPPPSITQQIPFETPNEEEMAIISIEGLPEDMTEREFKNMFLFCKGFDQARLTFSTASSSGQSVSGFVKFQSRCAAEDAIQSIHGKSIDTANQCIIRCKPLWTASTERELSQGNPEEGQTVVPSTIVISRTASRNAMEPEVATVWKNAHTSGKSSQQAANIYPPFGVLAPTNLTHPTHNFGQSVVGSGTDTLHHFNTPHHNSQPQSHGHSFNYIQVPHIHQQQNFHVPRNLIPEFLEPADSSSNLASSGVSMNSASTLFDQTRLLGTSLSSTKPDLQSVSQNMGSKDGKAPGTPVLHYSSPPLTHQQFSQKNDVNLVTINQLGSNCGFESALYHNLDSNVTANLISLKPSPKLQPQPSQNSPSMPGGSNSSVNVKSESSTCSSNNSTTNPLNNILINPAAFKKVKPVLSDQNNPPCNTLYVGNLPMNASEDELRKIFSHCQGYKRLCFRLKPSHGPMCFVEFETIEHASIALNTMYGFPLSNSTKGGIRLSYSKNPLGVRSMMPQLSIPSAQLSPPPLTPHVHIPIPSINNSTDAQQQQNCNRNHGPVNNLMMMMMNQPNSH